MYSQTAWSPLFWTSSRSLDEHLMSLVADITKREWGTENRERAWGTGKWKKRRLCYMYPSLICIIKHSLHHTLAHFKSIVIVWCLVINRYPPPSQPDDKPDAPLGAPPPYRLPPQPAVNVSSPDGNNQYYPGSAQGDWWLGYSVVSRILWFVKPLTQQSGKQAG